MATIKEAYFKLIEEKGFKIDPVQVSVAERYDKLREKILTDAPIPAEDSRSFIQKMMSPFAEGPVTYSDPRGLYIYGRVGRGKTFLMDLFFDNIEVPKIREHYYHFMQDVHKKMRGFQGSEDPLKLVAKEFAKECKVLCVDEFHVIDITDAMILYRLLDALLAEGIFFITTSNREPDALYKNGLQRQQFLPAIEIIKNRLELIVLDTDQDYRMRHIDSAEVWFVGDKDAQESHFRTKFEDIAGDSSEPVTLDVNGHKFEMIEMFEQSAWFTFDEACKKARSSQDFIYLANILDTVFFSELPELTRDLENEARRFVIMIDEFYDQGVKVIIGSDVPMDKLYQPKGEKAIDFEFDRTISRLIEMQSQEYLDQPKRKNGK